MRSYEDIAAEFKRSMSRRGVSCQLGDDAYELDPSVEVRAGDAVAFIATAGEHVRVRVTRGEETIYDGLAIRRDVDPLVCES